MSEQPSMGDPGCGELGSFMFFTTDNLAVREDTRADPGAPGLPVYPESSGNNPLLSSN